MPLNVGNEEINRLGETLATRKHMSKTDAVKLALENEFGRIEAAVPLTLSHPPCRAWAKRTA